MATDHRCLFGQRMNVSKRIVAGIIVVAAVVASLTMLALPTMGERAIRLIWAKAAPSGNPASTPIVQPAPVSQSVVQPSSIKEPLQESCGCLAPSDAPSEAELTVLRAKVALTKAWLSLEPSNLDAFYALAPDRQLEFVTAYRNNSNLSDAGLVFLKKTILDKRLGVVTRNAIANVLVANFERFPQQQTLFEEMLHDSEESPVWREYALQHFAQTAFSSQSPETICRVLMKVAKSDTSDMAATAMIQLSFLERSGAVELSVDYANELSRRLADPKGSLASKISMIGLIGSRRMDGYADAVRHLALSDQPSLRRVAIATLGLIGDESDSERLKSALTDKDPSVAIAARSAYDHLLTQASAH